MAEIVHLEKLDQEPGGNVESEASRDPGPESTVFARADVLVGAVRLLPSAELENLCFHVLLAELLLELLPRRCLLLVR